MLPGCNSERRKGLEGFGSMASIISPSDVVRMPSFNLRKNVFVPFIFQRQRLEGRLDWLDGSGSEGSATLSGRNTLETCASQANFLYKCVPIARHCSLR